MTSKLILREDDFSLELHTSNGLDAPGESGCVADIVGHDGYVLQERIILPPHLPDEAANFSARTFAPLRANAPLIFNGHPDLPVQYGLIIARANTEKALIEKGDSAIRIQAVGMNLLFSAPISENSEETTGGFSPVFNRIGELLADGHMQESAIARTWLFMEDILRDYEELNRAREEFFKRWLTSSHQFIPASTGIQGHMTAGRVLSVEFSAFSGERISIKQLPSPLQNEPTDYGKLFSRAVRVRLPKNDLIFISGTASIDKTGASIYPGDFNRQMAFTLEVLSTLLGEVGGDLSDVVQGMVYLKHGGDLDACLRLLDEAGFPRSRVLFQLDVDVCRDDLLCEIEATAVMGR